MKTRGNFSKAVEELMNGKLGGSNGGGAVEGSNPEPSAETEDSGRAGAETVVFPGGSSPVGGRVSGEEGRITRDMTITGSVTAVSDLRVSGTIVGDVKTEGALEVDGKIEGKVSAGSIALNGAKIVGDIASASLVTVGSGSSVEGDVRGERVDVDAVISGNIHCAGTVILRTNASVQGSIEAASLSMAEGAEWKGDAEVAKANRQGA